MDARVMVRVASPRPAVMTVVTASLSQSWNQAGGREQVQEPAAAAGDHECPDDLVELVDRHHQRPFSFSADIAGPV
jgi:hypothetical protein